MRLANKDIAALRKNVLHHIFISSAKMRSCNFRKIYRNDVMKIIWNGCITENGEQLSYTLFCMMGPYDGKYILKGVKLFVVFVSKSDFYFFNGMKLFWNICIHWADEMKLVAKEMKGWFGTIAGISWRRNFSLFDFSHRTQKNITLLNSLTFRFIGITFSLQW